MHLGQFVRSQAPIQSYKRLAHLISPLPLKYLVDLFCVDLQGRNPHGTYPLDTMPPEVTTVTHAIEKAEVVVRKEPPLLLGRDLLDSIEPGPALGDLLERAYQLQIDEGIRDKEELRRRVLKLMK
jgi:hypothetical protein